jgi:hypothetical protein
MVRRTTAAAPMTVSARARAAMMAVAVLWFLAVAAAGVAAAPRRILVDTDMDTDDLLALLYILKHSRSEFDVKVGAMSPSLSSRGLLPAAALRVTAAWRLPLVVRFAT